jgi:hypothetical protein
MRLSYIYQQKHLLREYGVQAIMDGLSSVEVNKPIIP